MDEITLDTGSWSRRRFVQLGAASAISTGIAHSLPMQKSAGHHTMISQKGLNDLIDDYQHALGNVNSAIYILEGAAKVATEVTGQFGQTSPASLIAALKETLTNGNAALRQIRNTRPTD